MQQAHKYILQLTLFGGIRGFTKLLLVANYLLTRNFILMNLKALANVPTYIPIPV